MMKKIGIKKFVSRKGEEDLVDQINKTIRFKSTSDLISLDIKEPVKQYDTHGVPYYEYQAIVLYWVYDDNN